MSYQKAGNSSTYNPEVTNKTADWVTGSCSPVWNVKLLYALQVTTYIYTRGIYPTGLYRRYVTAFISYRMKYFSFCVLSLMLKDVHRSRRDKEVTSLLRSSFSGKLLRALCACLTVKNARLDGKVVIRTAGSFSSVAPRLTSAPSWETAPWCIWLQGTEVRAEQHVGKFV